MGSASCAAAAAADAAGDAVVGSANESAAGSENAAALRATGNAGAGAREHETPIRRRRSALYARARKSREPGAGPPNRFSFSAQDKSAGARRTSGNTQQFFLASGACAAWCVRVRRAVEPGAP